MVCAGPLLSVAVILRLPTVALPPLPTVALPEGVMPGNWQSMVWVYEQLTFAEFAEFHLDKTLYFQE